MSTLDVVFLVLFGLVFAGSLTAAGFLLIRRLSHPGAVRLFGRPVPQPALLATAYLLYAVSFGLRILEQLPDGPDHSGVASSVLLLGLILQIVAMRDRSRTSS